MRITVTGASGFLGKALLARLTAEGHQVVSAGRRPGTSGDFLSWPSTSAPFPREAAEGRDAIIHLAGEPVAQRWNRDVKQRIVDSRVRGTSAVVDAIRESNARPQVLISASAIGLYGDRGEEVLGEGAAAGVGFLADTCVAWENAARKAEELGVRVVRLRIGIVLGKGGGALAQMLTPFRLGLGGRIGNGRQWMSWIHVDDIVGLVEHALGAPALAGAVNAVSPEPARNADFTAALARAVHRPAVFPVPVAALRVLFGEMAQVMLASQRVAPEAALGSGYRFRHAGLGAALESIV